ncbi:MAG: glycerophosphodiester phosphodiesterase, partial [Sphingomonadales bacterium]|nr:glycerophosphodiester phosphodiesterase [Sphingomonadales bacterium]
MKRSLAFAAAALALISAFAFLNNTALLVSPSTGKPKLLAHRGLAQTFSSDGVKADTCTAERIHAPQHPFIENTIPSMQRAFELGAEMIELDVHPTTDGQFAVFHDWTVDCRTNGKGVTREHSLAALKALDIGYGYTANGGKTFPFRGKGIGLLPSLDEVLAAFPGKRLLIHIKSNDPGEGELLARRLGALDAGKLGRLSVYGGERPVDVVRERLPQIATMHGRRLKQCLVRYLALGWTGYVPTACRRTIALVPINYAHWLWGWPDRFLERMGGVSSDVFVIGPWQGGEFSTGIDDVGQLAALPVRYSGGIWTNRIDRIAPALKSRE